MAASCTEIVLATNHLVECLRRREAQLVHWMLRLANQTYQFKETTTAYCNNSLWLKAYHRALVCLRLFVRQAEVGPARPTRAEAELAAAMVYGLACSCLPCPAATPIYFSRRDPLRLAACLQEMEQALEDWQAEVWFTRNAPTGSCMLPLARSMVTEDEAKIKWLMMEMESLRA
jgi:hypothetical protein